MCSVESCEKEPLVRGWCAAHYTRWKRYGDPTYSPGPSGKKPTPLADRFWPKVDKRGDDECWPWTGHIKRNGYGAMGERGKVEMAHRVAYALTYGAIPEGSVVDHKCRSRSCVNPRHLQAVTPTENQQNRANLNPSSASGFRNVHWYGPYQKWLVVLTVAGRRYSRGYFNTPEEAAVAAVALRNEVQTNNLQDRKAS